MLSKKDIPTLIIHWGFIFSISILFVSGARIAADSQGGSWSSLIKDYLPQGNMYDLHRWAAIALLGTVITYATFLGNSGLWRRISWKRFIYHFRRLPLKENRWNVIHLLIYWLLYILLLTSIISGLFLYSQLIERSATLLNIHSYSALILILSILLHIFAKIFSDKTQAILKLFIAKPALLATFIGSLLASTTIMALLINVDTHTQPELMVKYSHNLPTIDGIANDIDWLHADSTTVNTYKGNNKQIIPVSIQAVHNQNSIVFIFRWPDESESLNHLPLVKTEHGWKRLEHGYQDANETLYYEDKFAVLFSKTAELAGAGSIHLGETPLHNTSSSPHHRGLHFTEPGQLLDVWHWKSIRSGLGMGLIDDNYFSTPIQSNHTNHSRYTGGYQKDPDSKTGYINNWQLNETGQLVPKFTPISHEIKTKPIFLTPNNSIAFDPKTTTLPTGTKIPSIYIESHFDEDRSDIEGKARWHNGQWTLEAKRKLDTGSDYDIAISHGIYFWVSVFNHSQTRHSYHLKPIKINLH